MTKKELCQELYNRILEDMKIKGLTMYTIQQPNSYFLPKRTIYQLKDGLVNEATLMKAAAHFNLSVECRYELKKIA